MTDVEKFEYKSQKKPIKFGSNYLGISTNNGLKCIVSCINLPNDIVNQKGVLRFSWNFNWNALKKRGIDRLSGYIVVLYEKTSRYQIMEGVKFDVDLKEPNQFIEKLIKTSVLNYDHHAMFEYSLVPHYTQIKEINEESMLMFTPSEQNDAILMVEGKKIHVNKVFLSCHSEFFRALFSSNHQEGKMNEIPIEEISYDDFKLLLGSISPNTVFPTDETVEKLLEMAHRFMMPSVIRHVEYYLLQISDIENEKKMLIGEKYGMTDLLEKSILKIDTAEKVTKWMKSPEYSKLSGDTRGKIRKIEDKGRKCSFPTFPRNGKGEGSQEKKEQ